MIWRALLFGFLVVAGGCTTASEGAFSSIPPSAEEDSAYFPVYKKWLKEESVVSQFQKKIEIRAVMLTDEFRRAYMSRLSSLRGDTTSAIDTGGPNRIGFVVSVFAPERAYETLDSDKIWSIQLKYGVSSIGAPTVSQLHDKVLLEPFFPFVNMWTKDYLIAFDLAHGAQPGQPVEPALPQSVSLFLRSALASLEMRWP